MSQSPPSSQAGAGGSPSGGARKQDAQKTPLNKRAYTLTLTFSRLLTAAIVALIGVSWVFMLGVMVGRGYDPDTKIHELTGRVLRSRPTPAAQEPPQAVLRPEELDFGPALRDKPLHNGTAALTTPRQTNGTAAHSVVGNATSVQAAQPPAQPAPQGAQHARFDLVYQVAVFREAAQADKLRERLEGEGVRNSLEKISARNGKSMYRVLAVRRGTEEDERQLLAVLERLKLGSPVLRSKKLVSGGEGAR
jgi:hypothetical protein